MSCTAIQFLSFGPGGADASTRIDRDVREIIAEQAARADEFIQVQAMAARIACERMTVPALEMLRDSVDCASSLPTRPGWERKAAAHAEIFRLLGEIAGHRAPGNPGGWAGAICDLIRTVGPAANGMLISSRRRLLAYLRAGDAGAAERELETHLRVLRHMGRLALPVVIGVPVRDS
jgi:DNA-binding FadR family transcriptional regulator